MMTVPASVPLAQQSIAVCARSYMVKHMSKLVCNKCGHEEPVPMHCGREMHVEDDQLVCWMGASCGHQDVPVHCGSLMRLVE